MWHKKFSQQVCGGHLKCCSWHQTHTFSRSPAVVPENVQILNINVFIAWTNIQIIFMIHKNFYLNIKKNPRFLIKEKFVPPRPYSLHD